MNEKSVFLMADDSTLNILLCQALEKELGCNVEPFTLTADKELAVEAMNDEVKCFVLCYDIEISKRKIKEDYKEWRALFPNIPFIIHNPDDNYDFSFINNDNNIRMFLTDVNDSLPYLLRLIRKHL